MAGKDFSEQAYQISLQFDDMMSSAEKDWQDEQARRFRYGHVEQIRKALTEIQLPVEHIIDLVDKKLNEIQNAANGK